MYHLFKRTVVSKNGKQVKRWYYWFEVNGVKKIRVCPKCTNRQDAQAYINALPKENIDSLTINEITKQMFLPNSAHVSRREQLGKKSSVESLKDCRRYIHHIQQLWGTKSILKLTVKDIVSSLLEITDRSSSWKNRMITILKEVYSEASWQGINVTLPSIPRFQKNYKKADILTTDEINKLFVEQNFPSYDIYLLLFLCLLCGLRLGEARAIQYNQIYFEKKILVVNGFCRRDGQKMPFLKKGNEENPKWRIVVLPDLAINLLKCYFDKKHEPDDFLFEKDGKPYRKEHIENSFRKALVKAKINRENKRLIPHSLRYTYVTRMRRYLPLDLVQKLAGHTTEGMTEYYTRFSVEDYSLAVLPALDAANKLTLSD